MGSLNFLLVRNFWKDRNPQPGDGFVEKLKASWAVFVLLVSGVFALITAILIAWPALAFLAARFFQ